MGNDDRFKQSVVATIARRAANQCSNPDCGAVTSGPTIDPTGSVNVGEAAHIYGANPGSARFQEAMISVDRSAITNAIWLCSICHKLIDDDPDRFPTGLLFEWQRSHEQRIAEQVGKPGAIIRRRYEERYLEELGRLSYLAERIVLEKGDLWEYRLTAEVLRFELVPILRRWDALKRGLYMKTSERVEKAETISWALDRLAETPLISQAFGELMNVEFHRAWGEPGVPGNELDIISTCRLFREMCESALKWEEVVRFVRVDEIFAEMRDLFIGCAGEMIEQAAKVPKFLTEITDKPELGVHRLSLTLDLPDGWSESLNAAIERALEAFADEL